MGSFSESLSPGERALPYLFEVNTAFNNILPPDSKIMWVFCPIPKFIRVPFVNCAILVCLCVYVPRIIIHVFLLSSFNGIKTIRE